MIVANKITQPQMQATVSTEAVSCNKAAVKTVFLWKKKRAYRQIFVYSFVVD